MKSASTKTEIRTAAAITLRGLARTDAAPDLFFDWSGRLFALADLHVSQVGGLLHPTGLDVVLASFPDTSTAFDGIWSLWEEIESTREGHHHGGLLGIGLAQGNVEFRTGHPFGAPIARALRLALFAEETGEVLIDDTVLIEGIPQGFGAHRARIEGQDRLGFTFHHLSDYR